MSDLSDGSAFKGVRDRLKMFESEAASKTSASIDKSTASVKTSASVNVTNTKSPIRNTIARDKTIRVPPTAVPPPILCPPPEQMSPVNIPPPSQIPPPPVIPSEPITKVPKESADNKLAFYPPPLICLSSTAADKTKPLDRLERAPPIPPPPPTSVKKTQPTNVVGWVATSNNIISETNSVKKEPVEKAEKITKPVEATKRPPILVAPPSVEFFKKVNQQNTSNASSFAEEEYDEDDDLNSSPWYFDVPKDRATKIMQGVLDKGTFLVRPSDNNQYVLMIRAEIDVVKKFKIQAHESGWILGDPSKMKQIHPSISSLVNYYYENGVKILNSNLKLKEPAPKK